MGNFDLVQFDLDGTLIDSVPQLAQAVNRMLVQLGFGEAGEQAVRHWVGNGADMLVRRALTAALGTEPGDELRQAARAAFDAAYDQVADQGLVFYPGVLDTLAALRRAGKRLAIVTNKPYRFVPAILAAAGLSEQFELVLGGDSLPEKKPSPAPLLHVCRSLDMDPARTLMVGDSENDVLAARAAGMAVVGLTYGYNYGRDIADSGPDWVLSDFAALADILLTD
ncbi:phosphoglycolate phosphatase [Zobellella denitrificans]|uniref:Phosphoglycolate phosphatase n=1 Tax=Zobellella denitrificans TaxID=347534 RepID=A0A231MTV2_9GAMM|nr:phosphoglycolate phosphatase [Zobellella denitrificans]ATG75083.1 phosphoglycolate phosphatase [Zobellella denitrificans]OXS13617.1 phosphoglycolate phosphatase [Zobellella denitrificans]